MQITFRGSDAKQHLNPLQPNFWTWDVKPLALDPVTLTLDVVSEIVVGEDRMPLVVKTLSQSLDVQVTIFDRIKLVLAEFNLFWTSLTAVGGGILTILAIWWRIRHRPDAL